MLDEGRVHLLATDAHDARQRPPNLSGERERAAARVGRDRSRALGFDAAEGSTCECCTVRFAGFGSGS